MAKCRIKINYNNANINANVTKNFKKTKKIE